MLQLEQIRNGIKQKTDNVIYLNFEDKRILTNISNSNQIIDYIENNRKSGKCYIFLDEIQMVENWQEACKTLRLYDNSIIKYLEYLEEAYIIESVKQYSTKTKSELAYYVKIYNTDVAFNSIRCMDNRYDLTHNLENVIYNELIYMGYHINVFNNNGKEIDFLAQKNNKKYFVQVAYSVEEEKTYNQEFLAFANIDNLSQKILITNDDIDYSTSTVKHIKLKDFLLMESLEDL